MNGKIKITIEKGEIIIEADGEGLDYLSHICTKLRNLSDDEAKTPANHYHISADMNNAEAGSIPAIIVRLNEK
jgi:hypothetical protein